MKKTIIVCLVGIVLSLAAALGYSNYQASSANTNRSGASGSSLKSRTSGNALQATVSTPTAGSATQPSPTRTPRGFVLMPVVTVTPQSDGSIVHIVQPGEVLMNIALAYNVKLSDLYALNRMDEKSVIFPGENVKIKGPDPTATPTQTATPTRIPTSTRRPTRTPTPTASITSTGIAATETPVAAAPVGRQGPDPLLIVIGVLLAIGVGLVAAGSILKRK